MTDARDIRPLTAAVRRTLRPPGSKSITNRAVICAALAEGRSVLTGVLDSDDTQVMRSAWEQLGVSMTFDADASTLTVDGCAGRIPAASATLDLHNSGTSIRFLTAAVCCGHGTYTLDGSARMRERPIADLAEALRPLGPSVDLPDTGCPPVTVRAGGLQRGDVEVRGDISSQFLSALLMAAPSAAGPVRIAVIGDLVSKSYVRMTTAVMEAFGAEVQHMAPPLVVPGAPTGFFIVTPDGYRAGDYVVEPDASAASYWLAAGALCGEVTVDGLSRDSLQGDVKFADVLEQMGADVEWGENSITVRQPAGGLKGVDVDMNDISDTAQTLAAVAVFADGPTTVRGVAHMRHKETDRVSAVVTELRRLGIEVDEHDDGMTITPGPTRPADIETYDDHRMAMSFALVGLRNEGVRILDPGCVGKTYPTFWNDLETLRQ